MLNVHIRANKMDMTEAIQNYINKKVGVFEKYLGKDQSPADLYVEIGKTTEHHKSGDVFRAEFNLNLSGRQFRSVAETENLYASIDKAQDEMIAELRNAKNKDTTMLRRGARRIKEMVRRIYSRN